MASRVSGGEAVGDGGGGGGGGGRGIYIFILLQMWCGTKSGKIYIFHSKTYAEGKGVSPLQHLEVWYCSFIESQMIRASSSIWF